MRKPNVRCKGSYPVTVWSGGTTTELYIYPPESSYAQRNFSWRVSMATVEDETSVFTSLPGVKRTLLLLSDTLLLQHEGHYEKRLQAFEQDTFRGDWHTVSYGKASDFNVMTQHGYDGTVQHIPLAGQQAHTLEKEAAHTQLIYIHQGEVELRMDQHTAMLRQGDVCMLPESGERQTICVIPKGTAASELIIATLYQD